MDGKCAVCGTPLVKEVAREDRDCYECPRCGSYSLTGGTEFMLAGELSRVKNGPAKLSHVLYQMTSREPWALLNYDRLQNILSQTELPAPQEQLDNLIQWLGYMQQNPGEEVRISPATEAAVGAVDERALAFIVEHAIAQGLVRGDVRDFVGGGFAMRRTAQLTFNGWEYFYELQKGHSSSRQAFMAMKFGDGQLDGIYQDYFKAAVEATGFSLKRLDEGQPAGLIDDRLRVEIRQSRFLIADLTHHNKGAYWEAGYAEGLGKPVIYTCRRDAFENGEVHFDTNHHLTVIWEPGKEGEAVEKLKATIRATLPDEAKLED